MSEYVVLVSERANDKKMNKIDILGHISVPITDGDIKMVPKYPLWPLFYSTSTVLGGLRPMDYELFEKMRFLPEAKIVLGYCS